MAASKIYTCTKCGKVLINYKPVRLTQQRYNQGLGYKQYQYTGKKYDLCLQCYRTFKKWVTTKETTQNEEFVAEGQISIYDYEDVSNSKKGV